ncbi:nucleoside 2-deoxyribosyltransferase [Dankookia rubra]|uniref:Nucleoside 2-deoxyribosyltransferase n=1 Tax=Dankookia rubra TaxID=1442381 RepID=A0A4V3AAR5_9PROT|nr:nucleoside 2-deoxyribosyltransferase [Dankookia rubra]TDH64545.1 nucleoside 2-deoxyribosyltransferase [Dankookia rubra]
MRLYLAGPEVFLADAAGIAAAKRDVCAAQGLVGVFPLDLPPLEPDPALPEWRRIYQSNEAHIRSCDALIANLTPFRGASADVGTVYELGFMRALGRPVFGYSNVAQRFGGRVLAGLGGAARRRADGAWEDAEGMAVEEFDRHDNLMLEGGIAEAGGTFETEAVPAGRRWHDLAAFARCVAAAARLRPVAGGRPGASA